LIYPIFRDILYKNETLPIQILSQDLAESTVHNVPYAVISITNSLKYNTPNIPRNPNRKGVLKLEFADVEEGSSAFTDDQASQIVKFVEEQINNEIKILVIHCTMGMSRSAGIGAAISKALNRQDDLFYRYYRPNSICFRKTLDAFYGAGYFD